MHTFRHLENYLLFFRNFFANLTTVAKRVSMDSIKLNATQSPIWMYELSIYSESRYKLSNASNKKKIHIDVKIFIVIKAMLTIKVVA